MPPGISSVTPMRSAVSAASARVKPTTPNLLAQYAVAAGSARTPRVEATVTTRPRRSSRNGSAARTTAAVAIRLTMITRSQSSGSMSPSSPQASIPAQVTTASRPPCSAATRRTASSASRGRERSTSSHPKPLGGGRRSSTTGVPPASSTAAATAAPRPDEPPVISTVPSASGTRHAPFPPDGGPPARRLLDQVRGGVAGHVAHEHGVAAPLLEHLGLGQLAGRVVAALRPHVRAQRAQDGARVVLLEDRDRADVRERREHRGAVALGHERPVRALQSPDGGVRVQAHDQAVAER